MKITRRNFLRFVPVSVGALALGGVVLSARPLAKPALPDSDTLKRMQEIMLAANERAAEPPLMETFDFSTSQVYYIEVGD